LADAAAGGVGGAGAAGRGGAVEAGGFGATDDTGGFTSRGTTAGAPEATVATAGSTGGEETAAAGTVGVGADPAAGAVGCGVGAATAAGRGRVIALNTSMTSFGVTFGRAIPTDGLAGAVPLSVAGEAGCAAVPAASCAAAVPAAAVSSEAVRNATVMRFMGPPGSSSAAIFRPFARCCQGWGMRRKVWPYVNDA
jgi:hypothetical protein